MSVVSSGGQRAIFNVIESDEPRDFGKAMLKKRTILTGSDQRIEVLRRLDEARVERLLPSHCGQTQVTRIEAHMTAIVAYIEYNISAVICCINLRFT